MGTTNEKYNQYVDLLMGKGITGMYKNTNLAMYNNSGKTIEDINKNKIGPPKNYDEEYSKPLPSKKKKKSSDVDPKLLARFLK